MYIWFVNSSIYPTDIVEYTDFETSEQIKIIETKENKYKSINNSRYYTDGNNISYNFSGNQILGDVDIDTFTILRYSVAKDKNHIYVEDRIQIGLDPESFTYYTLKKASNMRIGVSFFTDKNGVYYLANDNKSLIIKPVPFDSNNVEFIGQYLKTNNGIYLIEDDNLTKLDGVDVETFRVLGTCYSVEMSSASYMIDANHVYVDHTVMPEMDPETLIQIATIESDENSEIPYMMTIWKDKNHIYAHCGKIIIEADYNTFEYLGDNKAQDKSNIYSLHTGGGYHMKPRQ